MHNGAVARKLGISSSVVGRLTSSQFLGVGDKRYDVGLAVRSANNFCVPECARPAQNSEFGWELSEKVMLLLKEYKSKFPWVIQLLESSEERVPEVASAFPGLDADGCMAKIKAIQAWRNSSPIASRKLVPASSKVRCAC